MKDYQNSMYHYVFTWDLSLNAMHAFVPSKKKKNK